MFEELGELVEATQEPDILDAAADFMIYASSYCNHKGWAMQEIWDKRSNQNPNWDTLPRMMDFVRTIGKLSHHHLKSEQKIRGKAEFHAEKGQEWLAYLFWCAERHVAREVVDPDLPRIACDVWRLEVQPRSWKQAEEAEPTRDGTLTTES